MSKHSNQSGFTLIEGLLVAMVVALIAVVGLLVAHNRQSSSKTVASSSTASKATSSSVKTFADCKASAGSIMQETYPEVCVTKSGQRFTNSSESVANPGTTQNYLVIKEWGVEIPLTADISDAYYGSSTYGDPSADFAVSTQKLAKLDPNCAITGTSNSFIDRQTVAEHDANQQNANPEEAEVLPYKIGNYYYGFQSAQAACSSDDTTNQLQLSFIASLKTAIAGIKAVN